MIPRTDFSLPLMLASSCLSACVSPSDDSNDDIAATESGDEAPPCMDDSAPPINCEYPLHCEVELDQWTTPEGTVEGDLNCVIDAFIDRGSASISLTYTRDADLTFVEEVQTIYPVTDEIAISEFDSQRDLNYDHSVERGIIMRPIPYFEDCENAGDEVAIFLCVWDWKEEGCGDTTLTCEE